MTRQITFVTAVADHHRELVKRCAASIRAQSISCEHIVIYDTEGRGAGYARNRGLAQVNTPFVSFLDSDDWIDPEFAEITLAAFSAHQGKHIIYTDWITADGLRVNAPDCAWTIWSGAPNPNNAQTAHLITTLALTDWWNSIGGFNEEMRGGEDTDAYLKLAYAGYCGRRVDMPLFTYGKEGLRSKAWRGTTEEVDAQIRWTQTYGGAIMGCCGSDTPISVKLDQQPGDVQVRPTWYGKRRVMSSMTGRDYGRVDANTTFWMDPRDAANKINPVEIIQAATPMPPAIKTFIEPVAPKQELVDQTSNTNDPNIARIGMAMGLMPPSVKVSTKDIPRTIPDISRILDKAGVKVGIPAPAVATLHTHVAQFVKPDKEYPSYTDFWRLVELSGYPIISQSRVNLDDPHAIYVWATPERWPGVKGAKARCIGWDLDLAGEYTQDYGLWHGEIWISDWHYASATNNRFVILGSHPDLAPSNPPDLDEYELTHQYDATMLGYMVERRQVIKDKLDIHWPVDYPGHGSSRRHAILSNTRLMLHVHQHENAPYAAPLRYALAAAYHMPVVSEKLEDEGVYAGLMSFSQYDYIPRTVRRLLSEDDRRAKLANDLYQYLCVEHTFAAEVEEGAQLTDPNTIEYLEEILHEVHGWLIIEEAELLYNLAREAKGSVIEIGSYHGRSTIALAKGIQARGIIPPVDYVYAIDPHDTHTAGGFEFNMGDNASFMFNMWESSVGDTVRVINLPSHNARFALRMFHSRIAVGLIFIDGAHEYNKVSDDFWSYSGLYRKALIAIHDSTGGWEGPTRVVKEAIESGDWELVTQVGYTSVLKRAK